MKRKLIYKYLSCKDALKTIENNCVSLNKPSNYNDPFDSIIEFNNNEEKRSKDLLLEVNLLKEIAKILYDKKLNCNFFQKIFIWFTRIVYKVTLFFVDKTKLYYSNIFIRELSKKIYNVYESSNMNEKLYEEQIAEQTWDQIREIRNMILVSCFSKKNNSILMWGHYGDKHTGVCVEFERPQQYFYDVSYNKKRANFPLYKLTSHFAAYYLLNKEANISEKKILKIMQEPLLAKSIEWKYEKEVRFFLLYNKENKVEKINLFEMPTPITGIYLGCKISDENKEKIIELSKKKNIPVFQFIESSAKYELIAQKINC